MKQTEQKPIGQIIGNAPTIQGMFLYQDPTGEYYLSRLGKTKDNILTKNAITELDKLGMIMWFSPEQNTTQNEAETLFFDIQDTETAEKMFTIDLNTLTNDDIELAKKHPNTGWAKYILALHAIRNGNRRQAFTLLQNIYPTNPLELNIVKHFLLIAKGQTNLPTNPLPPTIPQENLKTIPQKYKQDFLNFNFTEYPTIITTRDIINFTIILTTTLIMTTYILLAFL